LREEAPAVEGEFAHHSEGVSASGSDIVKVCSVGIEDRLAVVQMKIEHGHWNFSCPLKGSHDSTIGWEGTITSVDFRVKGGIALVSVDGKKIERRLLRRSRR
jgi:hypothetical protein